MLGRVGKGGGSATHSVRGGCCSWGEGGLRVLLVWLLLLLLLRCSVVDLQLWCSMVGLLLLLLLWCGVAGLVLLVVEDRVEVLSTSALHPAHAHVQCHMIITGLK